MSIPITLNTQAELTPGAIRIIPGQRMTLEVLVKSSEHNLNYQKVIEVDGESYNLFAQALAHFLTTNEVGQAIINQVVSVAGQELGQDFSGLNITEEELFNYYKAPVTDNPIGDTDTR